MNQWSHDMAITRDDDPVATPEELSVGLTVQTFIYPSQFELAALGEEGEQVLERVVGLTVDDGSRFKRRSSGDGYVYEVLSEAGWNVEASFEELEELLSHDLYRRTMASDADEGSGDPELEGEA